MSGPAAPQSRTEVTANASEPAAGQRNVSANASEPAAADRYSGAWWRHNVRRAAPLIALAVAAIVVALVMPSRVDPGVPLHPESTGHFGTSALVDVLRGVGRDVEIVAPDDPIDAPVILLLRDQLGEAQRAELERQVETGARLVVVDPNSALAPTTATALSPFTRRLERACDVAALRDSRTIQPEGGALFEVPEGAEGCFTTEDGAWLVIEPRGRGHVVATGSPVFLTNWRLAQADNAVLAVHLLTPADSNRTAIVRPVVRTSGGESQTLLDLVSDNVRAAMWQVLIGFLVLVAWRARRLGAPLVEETPVRLASSDLTAAVGALLARHDTRAATLERIAADTQHRLAQRLDLPATVDVEELATRLAERTPLDATALRRRLEAPAPATDADLVRATTDLADLEVTVDAALSSTLEEANVD
jgi:hypothetical protein